MNNEKANNEMILNNLKIHLENELSQCKQSIYTYKWYTKTDILNDRNRAFGSVLFAIRLSNTIQLSNEIMALWNDYYLNEYNKLID